MNRVLLIGFMVLVSTLNIRGQETEDLEMEQDYYNVQRKQIGFNMTELVSLLIPFKRGTSPSGPFAITWRAGRGNSFFNFQMGSRITNDINDDIENSFLNIQLGLGRSRMINDKFSYFNTTNVLLSGGGLNLPGEELSQNGLIGISFGGGMQYEIYKNISMVVETYFILGRDSEQGIEIRVVPPIGLFLIANF